MAIDFFADHRQSNLLFPGMDSFSCLVNNKIVGSCERNIILRILLPTVSSRSIKKYRAFKCKRSSVVLLAPLNEDGITAVALSGLGMFAQACSNRCPEPHLQPPCAALVLDAGYYILSCLSSMEWFLSEVILQGFADQKP